MSLDTRNNSALFKRAEQLRRWEESDTNREPAQPRLMSERKIKFSLGCVFLAACMAGDKEEVVRLIEKGADIDTANVDGLTALHQACIDDNLDMVEFLIEHGADINRADNEGWTPLHATASCGFVSIARYLIDNGAELDLVNSDGELPIDLAASNAMENLLQQYIHERSIDCEEARQKEEKLMLADAKKWLRSDAAEADKRHPRTGATALHVAAAKGYAKVLSLLLAGRANVDQQDNDGWTPLHAAAHWGQLEAAQMLVSSLADLDIKNYAGQTAVDVADQDVVRYLEDMKKKKNKRRPGSQLRISDSLDINREAPAKVIRVDVKPDSKDDEKPKPPPTAEPVLPTDGQASDEDHNSWRRSSRNSQQDKNAEKENQADSDVILRRTHSFESDEIFYQKLEELRARIKNNSSNSSKLTPPVVAPSGLTTTTTNTIAPKRPTSATLGQLAKRIDTDSVGSTGASEGVAGQDDNQSLLGTNKLNSNASNQINSVQRSASLKDHRAFRPNVVSSPPSSPVSLSQQQQTSVRRSFVPPVRDEESETQRKAHAKRVRETRRSTQGVTLDEIKSAEELVKKKNLNSNGSAFKLEDAAPVATTGSGPAPTTATASPSVEVTMASATATVPSTTTAGLIRRPNSLSNAIGLSNSTTAGGSPIASPTTASLRPVSAPFLPHQSAATEATSGDVERLPSNHNEENNNDDKDNDKENDNRTGTGGQSTQGVIQRRRRPKRRSTGVVHIDMDDLEGDRDSTADAEDKESGGEESRKSRLSDAGNGTSPEKNNGEIDYKALYEATKAENEKLREEMRVKDGEISSSKAALERFTNATTKNSLSELEKRERRAMERKMSEMEEELKQLDVLKTENQRLKDENGALIRVISKLSK